MRLPTESEWEYACRANSDSRFYTGENDVDLDKVGWYRENSKEQLHPVGEKEPNSFGLYDMHGNVWEWVEDKWHDSYKGAPKDGRSWIDKGSGRVPVVVRGSTLPGGAVRLAVSGSCLTTVATMSVSGLSCPGQWKKQAGKRSVESSEPDAACRRGAGRSVRFVSMERGV